MPRARRRRAPSRQRRPRRAAGPSPASATTALLAAIHADLERSLWTGEGHRKVWARLRAIDGVRVSRKRLLRLMREHGLLSPHRARTRSDAPHDRRIVTEAPNVMWATDATQIVTVQDGKVWLFGVAEHWNAELLGWHVAKRGTRFEALQAVGMAVRNQFDRVDAGAARGLALRHDHGSNFMSDAFQKQIRSWGIAPSYPLLFTGSGAFPRFWFAVILVAGRRSGFSPLEGSHFLMTRWRKGTGEGADAPSVRGRAGRARRASWRRGPPRDDRPRRPGARLWRFR